MSKKRLSETIIVLEWSIASDERQIHAIEFELYNRQRKVKRLKARLARLIKKRDER